MRKGQDRKVKMAGKAGCLGLLTLGLVLVNPVGSSVYAEEDYGIDPQALSQSVVGISFSPAAGSTSITPITSAGQSAQINVKATVDVANSGGYSVYLKSNSQNLVGVNNPSNVIPGIAGNVAYDNLATNTWGYYVTEGEVVSENATYKAVSTGQGDKIAENTNSKIVADTKNIMLSFVAKIGDNMPADTYQSTVTMSVVSSPVQLALGDITEMQQMTSEICENTAPNATKQLKDVRDGKYYWVSKLADNKCWMTQNLDLDIPAGGFPDKSVATNNMTWQNSDMTAAWTNPTGATTTVLDDWYDADNPNRYVTSYSWDQGLYVLNTPTAGANCGNNAAGQGLSNCSEVGFVDVSSGYVVSTDPNFTSNNGGNAVNVDTKEYDAHYLVGNWYQWPAATAGTGTENVVSDGADGAVDEESKFADAPSSICPKGWRLPKSGRNGVASNYSAAVARDDSIKSLLMQHNPGGLGAITISTDTLVKSPLYFVRGGYISSHEYLNAVGNQAGYWSSTAYTDTFGAYGLAFSTATNVYPANYSNRYAGFSVRCVAR